MAFDAYDLAMSSLRTLQKLDKITEAQFQSIKEKYGWPCWRAIKAADVAVSAWASNKSASNQAKMDAAFDSMYQLQKLLAAQVTQLKGGK
jgi:hypothetical protein